MASINKKISKDIKYTGKDFPTIRKNLLNFAKTYYPTTFNDFNEASPGMMFLETTAYVGDVLSFYLDKQFKDILNELEKDGLLENTIIIFSSDHSDGLPRYKRELFDTGIKVPFIINWSKTNFATQFSKNTISTDLVSFIDIAPTVLDIVGINIPSYMDGISILSKKNTYIYAARDRLDDMPGRLRAIRSKNFKLIKNYMPEVVGAQKLAFRENIKI